MCSNMLLDEGFPRIIYTVDSGRYNVSSLVFYRHAPIRRVRCKP